MADPENQGLLDGLQGAAREQRAELIGWLLQQGITVEQIRDAPTPLLLAAARVVGDDGSYVSTREVADAHGIDLDLLQRVQRAIGLARVDDPDAAVHMRADAEAAAHVQHFATLGLDPDNLVLVMRVIAEGLSHAAEVMRQTALAAVAKPGATELEIAKRYQALVSRIAPLLGPWIEDMLFMQLRHMMETEAVNASGRAVRAPLPGARQVTVAFADVVGFTRLGETVPPEELEQLANRLADLARDVATPPVRFVKTIGDAVMFVSPDPAPLLDAVLEVVEAADTKSDFSAGRRRIRAGGEPGRRLVRQSGEPGEPGDRGSAAGRGAGRRVGASDPRRHRWLPLVFRRAAPPQGHQGRRQTLPRPARPSHLRAARQVPA